MTSRQQTTPDTVSGTTGAPRPAPPDRPFARDVTATALVLGVASIAWFGWSAAQAPAGWGPVAAVGSAAGLVVAVAAVVRLLRVRGTGSVMADAGARRRYNLWVGGELVAIVAGWAALAAAGAVELAPAWVLAVVGAHFVPLAALFRVRALHVCGLVLLPVAAAAVVASLTDAAAASTVAGGAGGLVMLVTATYCLVRGAGGRPVSAR